MIDIVTNVSHLLIVTNSAINIVVYALKVSKSETNLLHTPIYWPTVQDFKFRQVLWAFFCGRQHQFKSSGHHPPGRNFSLVNANTYIQDETGPSTNFVLDLSMEQSIATNVLTTDF